MPRSSPRGSAGPTDRLTDLFHALADRTRRDLLVRLTVGSASVGELARPYRMSLPAISKHLKVLERAGLLSRSVDGRVHRLSLHGAPLEEVEAWLDPFRAYWAATLRALDADLLRHPLPSTARRGTVRGRRRRAPGPERGVRR